MNSQPILTQAKVDQIVQRMAYQIHENNVDNTVALVGVDTGGRKLADQLNETLASVFNKKSNVYTLSLDKENPLSAEVSLDGDINELEGKAVVLCDDVLNSGRTLAYSLTHLLSVNIHKVESAVLVLRTHGRFPIYATYKGYELSTTIQEHVEVVPGEGVYLS